jgi:hypothetical protein
MSGRLWLVVLIVVAVPLRAHAADSVEERLDERALRDRAGVSLAGFRWGAFAQLATGAALGSGGAGNAASGVGAEIAFSEPECDLVRIGGATRWESTLDGQGITGAPTFEQWGSVCVGAAPLSFQLTNRLEWDAIPSITSSPLLFRAGRNRFDTISLHYSPFTASFAPTTPNVPRGEFSIFDITAQADLRWAPGALVSREVAEAVGVRYVAPRRDVHPERRMTLDFFDGGGEFVTSGAVVHAWIVRVDDVAVAARRVFLSAGAGIASGGAGPWVDVERGRRAVDVTTPRAFLGATIVGRRVNAWVRIANDVDLVPDGWVVIDRRASVGVETTASIAVRLEGFAALDDVYVPFEPLDRELTGGAALSVAHALGRHALLAIDGDLGRSFDMADPSATMPRPRFGARVLAVLSLRMGR